jgi:hypothetical protein
MATHVFLLTKFVFRESFLRSTSSQFLLLNPSYYTETKKIAQNYNSYNQMEADLSLDKFATIDLCEKAYGIGLWYREVCQNKSH